MKTVRYRHLENSLVEETIEEVADEDDKGFNKKKIQKPSPFTIENFGWIAAAIAICYYTDFFSTVLYDERIDTSWLHATILCGAVLMFVVSYLILYLYMFKHIDPDDWDRLYPSAIPCVSASAVLFGICLTVSVWPVWGVFSLPLLFVLLMAAICAICMLDIFKFLCKKYDENDD